LWVYIFAYLLVSACGPIPNYEIIPPPIPEPESQLVFTFSNQENTLRSEESLGPNEEPIVFIGEDILWFNGTTKEIRFKDNVLVRTKILSTQYKTIKSYIDDEYLFSSLICVSEINSQIYNSLVLFYSQTENRFYLKDGYPDALVTDASQAIQALRNENRKKIEPQWNQFIDELKKGERYLDE
jgi:hypothetical protein